MKKFQIMNGRSASLPDGVKREGEGQKQKRQGTVQAEQLLGIYRPFANPHPTQLTAIAENSNRIQFNYSVFYQYCSILSVIQYFICLIAIEIPIGSSLNFSSEVSEQSRRLLIESETCEREFHLNYCSTRFAFIFTFVLVFAFAFCTPVCIAIRRNEFNFYCINVSSVECLASSGRCGSQVAYESDQTTPPPS